MNNHEYEELFRYARNLAIYMHKHFYGEVTHWRPLSDLMGVLTQIDNMLTGLERKKD